MIKFAINSSFVLLLGFLLFPFPTFQHFIWPLSWCLLADICNHTWIPECGAENISLRMFIDECDMFEFNCDYERDFEIVNYSDCFVTACPTNTPCPSHPTCKGGHRRQMVGEHLMAPERRMMMTHTRGLYLDVSLPMHMMKGKRRYTPETKIHKRKRLLLEMKDKKKKMTKKRKPTRAVKYRYKKTTKSKMRTVILKQETVIRDGKKYKRIVKGYSWKFGTPFKIVAETANSDSDFLV